MFSCNRFAVNCLWKGVMIYVLAAIAALAVVAGLSGALYGWFQLSLRRYQGVVARDVLTRWDAELAELPADERDQERWQPPVEVLEAILALPAERLRRHQRS
jgi:hypothetical protein